VIPLVCLPEGVTAGGVIAITLVSAVGWLARMDLTTRPHPAGPLVPIPGARCLGALEARLALFAGVDPRAARDAELGLRAVVAGEVPLVPSGCPLLAVSPREIVVTALKPAEDGHGFVLRLLNPTEAPLTAEVSLGFAVSRVTAVRLDEVPDGGIVSFDGGAVSLVVPPHAPRSLRVHPK
jgi:mannosylglycerate hydrolase